MSTLTNTAISNLEPQDKEYVVSDTSIKKLKVRIAKSGSKTFYLYYKKAGKLHKYRIGKFGEIGLPAARKSAELLLAKIALGENPQADRQAKRVSQKQEANALLRSFLDELYYPYSEQHQKTPWRTRQILESNFSHFMNRRMDSITKSEMDRWSQKKLSEGIKPSSINRCATALIAALNKAVEWEVISLNPLSGRKRLKVDSMGVVRYLSAAEEQRLYKALSKREGNIALIVPLLLNTGARPKEALNLRWEDVDLEGRRLTLQAAFTKTQQTRYIPINAKLLAVLNAQESKSGWLFPNQKNTGPIFTIQKAWKNLKAEAGIENFRLYDCRHTFASKLAMAGISIYEIAELLGHSSIEMSKIYAHLSPDHLKAAVDVL